MWCTMVYMYVFFPQMSKSFMTVTLKFSGSFFILLLIIKEQCLTMDAVADLFDFFEQHDWFCFLCWYRWHVHVLTRQFPGQVKLRWRPTTTLSLIQSYIDWFMMLWLRMDWLTDGLTALLARLHEVKYVVCMYFSLNCPSHSCSSYACHILAVAIKHHALLIMYNYEYCIACWWCWCYCSCTLRFLFFLYIFFFPCQCHVSVSDPDPRTRFQGPPAGF